MHCLFFYYSEIVPLSCHDRVHWLYKQNKQKQEDGEFITSLTISYKKKRNIAIDKAYGSPSWERYTHRTKLLLPWQGSETKMVKYHDSPGPPSRSHHFKALTQYFEADEAYNTGAVGRHSRWKLEQKQFPVQVLVSKL